jgi:hypothetical protein
MREYGKPCHIDRDTLFNKTEAAKQYITKRIGIEFKVEKPDNILEGNMECTLIFLEQGLLPTMRDSVTNPTNDELYKMADEFLQNFKGTHPKDIDIQSPERLIEQASSISFQLSLGASSRDGNIIKTQNLQNLFSRTAELLDSFISGNDNNGTSGVLV